MKPGGLAAAIIVAAGLVAGGSYAVVRYRVAQDVETGKGLATERAAQKREQQLADSLQQRMTKRKQSLSGLLRVVEDSLRARPLDSMLLISAGNISYDIGEFDKAVRFYRSFLTSVDPGNTMVRIDYAYAMYASGKQTEGIDEMKRVIARAPTNQAALLNLAAMYGQMNQLDEAVVWFTTCRDVNPTTDYGKRASLALDEIRATQQH
jgi:tetratricopeptide (TPR) repeat protein